jgi:hypothetical protein
MELTYSCRVINVGQHSFCYKLRQQRTTAYSLRSAVIPKHNLWHTPRFYFGRYFAGIGFVGDSASQKMLTTQYRSPSFNS